MATLNIYCHRQCLSGRALDLISRGQWFKHFPGHCLVSMDKALLMFHCLVLVKPNIIERPDIPGKSSTQTNRYEKTDEQG